jgi:hypothetical protein
MKPAADASAADCKKLLRETLKDEDIYHRQEKRFLENGWK